MPISVSRKIKSELPAHERKDIKKWLEAKAWGTCFQCERPIDITEDDLVADHDETVTAGGVSVRDNLNLSHSNCNTRKQGLTTRQARAIIQVENYILDSGPDTKYGDMLSYFNITPALVTISDKTSQLIISAEPAEGRRQVAGGSPGQPTGRCRARCQA